MNKNEDGSNGSNKSLERGEGEDDDEFDFGRAKMDFFKKRAREILMSE